MRCRRRGVQGVGRVPAGVVVALVVAVVDAELRYDLARRGMPGFGFEQYESAEDPDLDS